jgi:hypothetical protein
MEEVSVLQRPVKKTDNQVRTNLNRPNMSNESPRKNQVSEKLASEIDENFMNYLNSHGLTAEDNLLVLSSKQHYYYDYDELKEVTTLINLKQLNLIKHLDSFLQTICDGLSPKTNFIGCFADRKTKNGVSTASRLYKRFINFLDAKTDYEIDKNDFSRLLESCGFKVIDMREINGLTYFRTQN